MCIVFIVSPISFETYIFDLSFVLFKSGDEIENSWCHSRLLVLLLFYLQNEGRREKRPNK